MNIEKQVLDDHQIEVSVETEQDPFDKAKHLAAKELSKDKEIPGYRPGKAPYQLVVNHVGEGAIIDLALENYLDEIYPEILDEIDHEPYGPGQLSEIESLEPPQFKFLIPLQPEVSLGDYQDVRIPYEEKSVTEDDIQEVLDRIISQQAVIEEVDHPAEEANIVDTSISGRVVDADPDDEEAQLMINQPLPVMIKAEDEEDKKEWPFPGFSRQLLGASPGESLELTHEHGEGEDVSEEVRGKEVLYTVEVEGIRERVLPELDDELAQKISDQDTVEDLRAEIQAELEEQTLQEGENAYLNQIFEAILEDGEVKFPPQMLENEVEGELQELRRRLQAQGMELETYLAMQEMEEEDLREQIRPEARKRIERGLILGKIADTEDLNIGPEAITGEYQKVLDQHFGEDESEERKEFMSSPDSMNLLNQISSQMISQQAIQYLVALAKGEDVSEYLAPEEEDEGETAEVAEQEKGAEGEVGEEEGESEPISEQEKEQTQSSEIEPEA